MTRTQWTLAGVLVLQVILLMLSAPWSGGTGPGASRPLLPELESFTPARLEILAGGEDGGSVELERRDGGWVLPGKGGYPVKADKVEGVLDDLEGITVRRPVVTGSRYHDALKVTDDDFERRVRVFQDDSGDPAVDLLVGTSPNYRISHVRLAGEDAVYEARGVGTYDLATDTGAWVDKQLLNIPAEDVVAMRLRNEHGEFRVERDGESWKLAEPSTGKAIDDAKVRSLVRSLSSLWLSEPAGPVGSPEYGLDEPVAEVEIAWRPAAAETTADDAEPEAADEENPQAEPEAGQAVPEIAIETVTLEIGAEVEDGKRYAAKSGFDFAVVLSKFDADKATAKKLADLYPEDD